MHKLLNTTAIQNELILNYKKYNLTAEEFICVCQMLTVDPLHIDLINFMRVAQNCKPLISSMVTKKLVNVLDKSGKMIVDLSPLYQLLQTDTVGLTEVGLSGEQIDKLVHIFNRNLLPNEINQVNAWMRTGATFTKIEEAIYIALAKGINNFNYIEKIILNDGPKSTEAPKNEGSIKRNWTY
ncbi:DnaD domain protein [Mollicutes bacterium LVI A0039]|nr:DnaD domain protein [Mollicutes bacterium LVI A0039]